MKIEVEQVRAANNNLHKLTRILFRKAKFYQLHTSNLEIRVRSLGEELSNTACEFVSIDMRLTFTGCCRVAHRHTHVDIMEIIHSSPISTSTGSASRSKHSISLILLLFFHIFHLPQPKPPPQSVNCISIRDLWRRR